MLSSSGTNASGYNGALANETLTITGTITPSGTTSYVLAVGPNSIVGADGGDIFQASSGALNSHDSLTGGNGANILQLTGAGSFDIGAPKVFANIQTINAQEGQAASGTLAATNQVLFLRDGGTEAVNVAASKAATGNNNAVGITIYDGNDTNSFTLAAGSDTLYLGAGNDTVTLGGTKNSIVAGGGTAVINADGRAGGRLGRRHHDGADDAEHQHGRHDRAECGRYQPDRQPARRQQQTYTRQLGVHHRDG